MKKVHQVISITSYSLRTFYKSLYFLLGTEAPRILDNTQLKDFDLQAVLWILQVPG